MGKMLCVLMFILAITPLAAVNQRGAFFDLGGALGTKSGVGLVFAIKYFPAEDLALEVYVTGNVHILGGGLEISYFPSIIESYFYPNLGISYLSFGSSFDESDWSSKNNRIICLNADLGYNSSRFLMPMLVSKNPSETEYSTAFYTEIGVSKLLWGSFQSSSSWKELFSPRGWWFPNIEFGFRQGSW